MLTAIRKRIASWFVKILFALLIASFALWGVTDYLGSPSERVVANVGDTEITEGEVSDRFRVAMNQLRRQFGDSIDRQLARQLGVPTQVMSDLVTDHLYRLEANDLGVRVPEEAVRSTIAGEAAFHGPAGSFDPERYRQVLYSSGLSEREFVRQIEFDLIRTQIARAIGSGGSAPAALVEAVRRHDEERRTVQVIAVPAPEPSEIAEPGSGILERWYGEREDQYVSPEYRSLTFVHLSPEAYAEDIVVSEDEIGAAYTGRRGQYETPEVREIAQLLFEDEEDARQAEERLATGATFDDVAEAARRGGTARLSEIGRVERDELFPATVAEAAFALSAPGTTEPISSSLGWHIVAVRDIEEGTVRPMDDVRDEVEREIALTMAVDELIEVSHDLEDAIATGQGLEQAARSVGTEARRVDAMDRQGRGPDGEAIEGLPEDQRFIETAFRLEESEESFLIETSAGGYFVVRVDGIRPPATRPFDEVRDQVLADWRRERATEQAREMADGIRDDIRAGRGFHEIAAEHGLATATPGPFRRDEVDPSHMLTRQVAASAFTIGRGDVTVAPDRDGGFHVVKVEEIIQPDLATANDDDDQRREDLSQVIQGELLAQYSQALRQKYGVEIREDLVRTLF